MQHFAVFVQQTDRFGIYLEQSTKEEKQNCTFADQSGDSNATHIHTQTGAFANSIKEIFKKLCLFLISAPLVNIHTNGIKKNVN